ncbi:hypothetical protein D3C85_1480730 [compost metagenome]
MSRQELRQIVFADQRVDRLFVRRHACQIHALHRGDDAVVGGYLVIVPGARAQVDVQAVQQWGQSGVVASQRRQHGRHFLPQAVWQIAAVGTGIGNRLVLLVQRLGDVQGGLYAEAQFS